MRYEEPILLTSTESVDLLRELTRKGECVVVCYNAAEVWQDRVEAAAFYAEGVRECDGCEAERYMSVLMDLLGGRKVCHDGVTEMLTRTPEYRESMYRTRPI